jgi:guanine nucleotide-binding protein subunit beta-2-like 1 protein
MSEFSIEPIGVLEGHGGAVTSLVCGENKDGSPLLISGSRDKTIIQWELNFEGKKVTYEDAEGKEQEKTLLGKPLRSFHGHNHFVSSLALNSDNTKLVSGSWDKTIRLWDVPSVKSELLFKGHNKDVLCVAFSHDERLIFSGAMDNSLNYWNVKGDLKFNNTNFGGWVSCILNIKKGKTNYMAVGCWDGKVKILNNEYNVEREIPGEDYAVTSLSADDDGDFLFIAYKNGTVKVWNIQEEPSDNELDNVKQTIETGVDINSILFTSKFFEIFAIGTSKGLQIRKIKGGKGENKTSFEDKCGACLSLAYDPSKEYLFAGYSNGTIKVYRTSDSGES